MADETSNLVGDSQKKNINRIASVIIIGLILLILIGAAIAFAIIYIPKGGMYIPGSGPVCDFSKLCNGLGTPKWSIDKTIADSVTSGDNKIFISGGHNITVISEKNLSVILSFGSYGSAEGQFIQQKGMVIFNNELYVTDSANNRVQVFSLDGTFKRKFGKSGTGDGELQGPNSVAIHGNKIYVGEKITRRVSVFDLNGVFDRKINFETQVSGLAISQSGKMFVSLRLKDEVHVINDGNTTILKDTRHPLKVTFDAAENILVPSQNKIIGIYAKNMTHLCDVNAPHIHDIGVTDSCQLVLTEEDGKVNIYV